MNVTAAHVYPTSGDTEQQLFSEKTSEIILVTRNAPFSSKCTAKCLALRFLPDLMGSLQHSPDSLAGIKG